MNTLDKTKLDLELRVKGYTVIPDVLTPDEVQENLHLFHTWQSQIPDHDFIHSALDPHGIYKHHRAGQTEHAWSIRTRPKVQAPFKHIWGTDDLNVSFDGCCFIPAGLTKRDTIWTHTDQAPTLPNFECVQGIVALTHNKRTTLVVYEGTHKIHHEYFKSKGREASPKAWQKIDPEDVVALESRKRVLEIPAGAMALWDSRTFHQNQYGTDTGPTEERIVQYVSFMPKAHAKNTPAIQHKRRLYFAELRTTSHWCSPLRVNPLQGQGYGDPRRAIDYDQLPAPDLDRFDADIRKLL
tara:strand:- start:671 stop:1558 length:888 start_codon:yes stop_codon:yes gene_type:complete